MADIDTLMQRIDAEFKTADEKIKSFQTEKARSFKEREARLERFVQNLDKIRDVWRLRLEALAKRFGDRVKVTPTVTPSRREATLGFRSELAAIGLRFSASANEDVTKAIFGYDLEIIPILMEFESHAVLEFPIDAIDRNALAKWIDDRIVSFVRTYLSLHENAHYLKDHMVEDPVLHVRFPKFAAGATIEKDGKTYYFVGEESRRQFEAKGAEPAKSGA